jgi:hypothetical protein
MIVAAPDGEVGSWPLTEGGVSSGVVCNSRREREQDGHRWPFIGGVVTCRERKVGARGGGGPGMVSGGATHTRSEAVWTGE